MQKDSAHCDVVWGICAELITSSDPCLVSQGAATLRSLLGIPVFRQVVARASPTKCGVGSALPHMKSWSPATRCIHATLHLLCADHSDERVLQDVLASLHMLLAASFGGDSVIAVCGSVGPAAIDNNSVSLWQLVSRLTALALHPNPSLACDAVVALSLLTSNAAGAAVCVLHRAAALLLWQVMCRCLQAISMGSTGTSLPDDGESLDALPKQLEQQDSEPDAEQKQQQEMTHAARADSAKAYARRNFMSEAIHGNVEHSFVADCNLMRDDYLLRPGITELLLYCSMHACINCCTVCASFRRSPSKEAHSSPNTALLSCSFGCSSYAHHIFSVSFAVVTVSSGTLSAPTE
jgi:hypothetical protein